MRLTANFSEEEFECPCCGKVEMNAYFMQRLQEARDSAGIPFPINSGYRCPKQNAEVSGVSGSSHISGVAADIACSGSRQRYRIISALLEVGFTRIGIAKTFIHVDDSNRVKKVIWTY